MDSCRDSRGKGNHWLKLDSPSRQKELGVGLQVTRPRAISGGGRLGGH